MDLGFTTGLRCQTRAISSGDHRSPIVNRTHAKVAAKGTIECALDLVSDERTDRRNRIVGRLEQIARFGRSRTELSVT
jgi:hypothetical protein